jgi:hypothetical protein
MKRKRGRPKTLLARMKGATREEIRNTIIYGTPAWRFIRVRQLLDEERKRVRENRRDLLPNYLSQGLRAMEALVKARAHAAQNLKTLDWLWNELCAKNKGKPPARRQWLKARNELLARLPKPPPQPHKTWVEAASLWRNLVGQIECALVIGDDDWLGELAKAIRGETSPEHNAKFTAKVLDLLQKMAGATTSDIFLELHTEELQDDGTWKVWEKQKKLTSRLRVENNLFETKGNAMDAINDIAAEVNHQFERINNPLSPDHE